MTEYWVSQSKKFCEFCKCWITDNRPSVDFHERGKKHQEMVKKKIEDVRKKGREVQKEKEDLQNDLAAIEAAALKAYQKDLAQNTPPKNAPETKVSDDVTAKDTDSKSNAECTIIYHGSEPVAHCSHSWVVSKTPEGYYYYYNSVSGESKWKLPNCMASLLQQSYTEQQSSNETKNDTESKQVSQQDDTKESEGKSSSGFGEWTTVQTFVPRTQSQTTSTVGDEGRQITTSEESSAPEAEAAAKKTEVKFKERATPKVAFKSSGGGEVSFKKRKLNPEKKRNIRQVTKKS